MSSWKDVTKKTRELRKNIVFRCALSFAAVFLYNTLTEFL